MAEKKAVVGPSVTIKVKVKGVTLELTPAEVRELLGVLKGVTGPSAWQRSWEDYLRYSRSLDDKHVMTQDAYGVIRVGTGQHYTNIVWDDVCKATNPLYPGDPIITKAST